jgi:hypothetical protein
MKTDADYKRISDEIATRIDNYKGLSDALSRHPDYAPQPASKDNPNQPRDDHGRWTSGDSPGKGEMDIDAAVAYLNKHAKRQPPGLGEGECATYVREAIEKGGGVKLVDHPIPAYQYALPRKEGDRPYLDNYFDRETPTSLDDYLPKKGVVVVFQPPPGQEPPKGHIQMYNGEEWVSDFKQGKDKRNFWPGPVYRNRKPPIPYVIYRPENWKKPKP